ncbi:MAG: hypothetical protein FJY73_09590 [Candidatus Eisenbacteria bacterium]|nr:hypothetical protein [Candidatus Eisenbacteria bacterium]
MNTRMTSTGATTLLLLSFGTLLVGCGGGDGSGPATEDPAALTSSGWEAFARGAWSEAASFFRAAIGADSLFGDAHNGLGWTHARADSLDAAADAFGTSIRVGFSSADPYAGTAVVLRDRTPPDYAGAITAARAALARDRAYRFAHDPSFDWNDLRVILAQCFFARAEYGNANAEVDTLGGTPANPESPSFLEDLLAEIERLSMENTP